MGSRRRPDVVSTSSGGWQRSAAKDWLARLLLLPVGACTTTPSSLPPPEPVPRFSVEAFFSGHTEGEGALKVIFAKSRSMAVRGTGRVSSEGELILDQIVSEAGRRPRQREWRISRRGDDRYAGTLSEASGGVQGEVFGNRLHLHFMLKGGLRADQWLSLRPDGRVADNVMIVRKFGVRVATLHETIQKIY
jgi:Protein of unknown function (DUF3833)